ncbi:hypothetical protein C2845_PM13G17310 [Panicum miliaceum]|uniref:Neprosin PEP catalytic domain-containing protein n=1 Tax=Panicum miliaceum TaxID=4540 RepID=A0A3L6RGP4_PANMI|nr:hypothetical protein C2845_PM13G17310 [Panicum miliaceum]
MQSTEQELILGGVMHAGASRPSYTEKVWPGSRTIIDAHGAATCTGFYNFTTTHGGTAPPPLEQEWHRSGSCPAGTVPIRRMPKTSVEPNITVVMPAPSAGRDTIVMDGSPTLPQMRHPPGQQQWWVSVNETAIGYFPHTLFPIFFPESFVNQVGGVVHNSRPIGVHTDTVMGNGRTPDSGSSAVVKAYLAIGASGVDKVDTPDLVGVTASKCYNAAILGENVHIPGFDIAYGGPGGRGCDQ